MKYKEFCDTYGYEYSLDGYPSMELISQYAPDLSGNQMKSIIEDCKELMKNHESQRVVNNKKNFGKYVKKGTYLRITSGVDFLHYIKILEDALFDSEDIKVMCDKITFSYSHLSFDGSEKLRITDYLFYGLNEVTIIGKGEYESSLSVYTKKEEIKAYSESQVKKKIWSLVEEWHERGMPSTREGMSEFLNMSKDNDRKELVRLMHKFMFEFKGNDLSIREGYNKQDVIPGK